LPPRSLAAALLPQRSSRSVFLCSTKLNQKQQKKKKKKKKKKK
jgi:hypothetical protein